MQNLKDGELDVGWNSVIEAQSDEGYQRRQLQSKIFLDSIEEGEEINIHCYYKVGSGGGHELHIEDLGVYVEYYTDEELEAKNKRRDEFIKQNNETFCSSQPEIVSFVQKFA